MHLHYVQVSMNYKYIVIAFLLSGLAQSILAEKNILEVIPCDLKNLTATTIYCIICDTPQSCKNPETHECTDETVQTTLNKIAKVLTFPKIIIKRSYHFVCFGIQLTDVSETDYDIRGCMYFQALTTDKPIVAYDFDFRPMYIYKARYTYDASHMRPGAVGVVAIERNFEIYNRTYWNTTHFPKISCLQCEMHTCNIKLSPYTGGKLLFQRPFDSSKMWNCIEYNEINKKVFKDHCLRDRTYSIADGNALVPWKQANLKLSCGDEYDWPNTVYVPERKYFGDWGILKISPA